jgi:hypothetical protein
MGPAQQGRTFVLLVVGQGEGGVALEIDVVHVAFEHERLAGGALTFLAAVHELNALLSRCTKDRLVLVDLDLDSDRLEPHDVLLTHWPFVPKSFDGAHGVDQKSRPLDPFLSTVEQGEGPGRPSPLA